MDMVMAGIDFLIPALMLLFGLAFWKAPSKKIDKWYGYRTKRALKSQEAYMFAQVRIGRIWTAVSVPLAAAALLLVLLCGGREDFTQISLAILAGQVVIMLACMWPVERALKRKFG